MMILSWSYQVFEILLIDVPFFHYEFEKKDILKYYINHILENYSCMAN